MVRSGETAGACRTACRTDVTLPPLETTYTVQKSGAAFEMLLQISALNLHSQTKPGLVSHCLCSPTSQCLMRNGAMDRTRTHQHGTAIGWLT